MPQPPRLTVLHVSQPVEAGVPAVIVSLVRDEIERGWQVHVACPEGAASQLGRLSQKHGATVHAWAATRSPGPAVLAETRALAAVIDDVDPDVVVLHSSKAMLAGRLATRGRRATVVMPHSWSFEAVTGPVAVASKMWERFGSRWTDLALCVSERERSVGQAAGALGKRAVVVRNGVDTESFVPRDRGAARADLGLDADAPTAVVVGRLARQKGQDVLLADWDHVTEEVPGARLILVGDGPDHEALEESAADDPSVSLVGSQDPRPWVAAADVVVLPSRWEGMPLVLLEAMSSGRAVVCTDVAGAREALGDGDWIVPVEEPRALADAVSARLADPARGRAEGERHRLRAVEHFDVRRSSGEVSDLLAELATR